MAAKKKVASKGQFGVKRAGTSGVTFANTDRKRASMRNERYAAQKKRDAVKRGAEGPKQSSPVKKTAAKKSLYNAKGQLKERPAKRGR